MQVANEQKLTNFAPSDKAITLKEGDIYHAFIKEKLPNDEAILQIRNQDFKVKFENPASTQGKTMIQVVDANQSPPLVKSAASADNGKGTGQKADLDKTLLQLNDGKPVSDGIKSAAAILQQKGIPLTKQTFQDLKKFIESEPGNINQKLETIAVMAKKGLDFTPAQMKSVHEALFGSSYGKELAQLAKEIDGQFSFTKVESAPYGKPTDVLKAAIDEIKHGDIAKAIAMLKDELRKDPSLSGIKKSLTQSEQLLRLAENKNNGDSQKLLKLAANLLLSTLKQDGAVQISQNPVLAEDNRLNEIAKLMKSIQKDPDLSKILQNLNGLTDKLSDGQAGILQNAIQNANQLSSIGKEMAARQELMNAMKRIEGEIKQSLPSQDITNTQDFYQLNDDLFASIPFQSKDFIVSKITLKLSQAAIDFKSFKQDVTRNLQTVEQNIGKASAKPLLEATIKQLDQTILKSDFMLYTDMKTEKKLMTASTQLAQAKQLLADGDYPGAKKIVSDIKMMIDKITFKPSDTRVQHFVSKELTQLDGAAPEKQLLQQFDQAQAAFKQQPTARGAFEYLKQMGLTHDADHAQALVQSSKNESALDTNMKNILMKLQNEADGISQSSLKVDGLMQNLTGQQLLSKNDPSGLQSMMFSLPLVLKDQVENVKVFINSNNSSQKIDWENCSLFFLLETKKLGDLGISLKTTNRNLSINIKNDSPGFKEKMAPLTDIAKERLEEIGYGIGSVQFSSLHTAPAKEQSKAEKPSIKNPAFTEKGYDFSI
ncbi:hypothetical protein [Falsibacillus pallidus]|uniref:Uncharacterized protein n=1 Tax=Falsibacillus pallidus TaxID=493781 RepID=A0A370GAC0_9BACI|nr:hypothetical protein [Falsibacillus pallidus]RDI40126.1 hypothetical protein DFR59_11242 [Falsibacillus pallidus]